VTNFSSPCCQRAGRLRAACRVPRLRR
jgi:hypothetical protein